MKKFLLQNCIVVPIRVAFFIAMMVLCTNVWGQNTCTWTGNTDANWNNRANWDKNAVPTATTDVIIPAGLARYPECTADSKCRNIYLAAGARLGKQHFLSYEKAFVDVSIPTNRYVRITPPLKETYSGDFFTQEQGGVWNGNFTAASYEPTEGVGGNNRVYPGATYQRVFSETSYQRGNYGETAVSSFSRNWSDPKNALNTEYKALQGLEVWVDDGYIGENDNSGTATFRFPSEETEYLYFDQYGKAQIFGETTARSAESGKFVWDKTSHPDGNITLNYWRAAGSDAAIFCIGNPAMAYLDLHQFFAGNTENITPFVFLHNEEFNNVGTETILYYHKEGSTHVLHQVNSVNLSPGELPTGTGGALAVNSPLRYIKPTQGFGVIAGGTMLHAVEPGLIGSTTIEYTEVRDVKRDGNSYKESANLSTTISIALDPSDPYKVELSNLVQLGNVEAIINPEQGTITIPNGTPIRYIDESWNPNDENKTLYIYGCKDKEASLSGEYIQYFFEEGGWFSSDHTYTAKYATNLEGADVVFKYKKNPDGSIEIEQQNAFVVYTDDMYEAIIKGETPNLYYKSKDDCLAWYVYKDITSTKNNSLGTNFILPEAEGVYESYINTKTDNQNSLTDIKTGEYGNITIHRINGTTNQVLISGLYPREISNVIGSITQNGSTYTLTIPKGQIVKQTDKNDPSKNWHLYYEKDNRAYDIVLTWDQTNKKWYGKNESGGRGQISQQNSNPSNSSPGFYLGETTDEGGWFTSAKHQFSLTRTGDLDSNTGGNSIENEITISQNKNFLALNFTPGMFVTNPVINPSAAPQRRKVQAKEASSLITITAQGEEYSGSTLLVKSEKGRAGYSSREDAPLSDISEQRFCMASLAGEQVVGVNVFNETDIIPLYIQGEAQKLTLSFGNIEALGWEAELYDAVEESSTDISKGECKIEIQLHGDQPAGRFFIRKKSGVSTPGEATSMEKEKEWAPQAWSPTKGTIVIMSQAADMQAEVMVTNVAGQSVVYEKASSIHTLRNLLPGVYVVQLRIGNSYWNKKVLVN